MKSKKCKRCKELKSLDDFYKHNQMADGRINVCKSCKRLESKQREKEKRNDPDWIEKERRRHREKYRRLGYKEKQKPTPEYRYEKTKEYRERYPEKVSAERVARRKVKAPKGYEKHHWSYKKEHQSDVIFLKPEDHYKAHRFLVYDQDEKRYRDDKGNLLETKSEHLKYLKSKGVKIGH